MLIKFRKFIIIHIKSYIGHVQEVVCEVFFDNVSLIAAANHKIANPMRRVKLQDVPKQRPPANFDHRLRSKVGFLRNSGSKTPGEYHSFHVTIVQLKITMSKQDRHGA